MTAPSMASGWYYAKPSSPGAPPTGPLTWEQFYALAQAGTLAPADLVWHETYPDWIPAAQVPGLFPARTVAPPHVPAPYPAPAQAGAVYRQTAPPTAANSSGRRRSWLYWTVPLVVLVLASAGLGVYFGFLRGSDDTGRTAYSGTGIQIAAASGVTLYRPEGWSWQADGNGGLTVAEQQGDLTAGHPAGARLVLEVVDAASSDMTSALADVLPSGTNPATVAAGFVVLDDPSKTQVGAGQAVSITLLSDDSTNPPLVTRYVIVELLGGRVFLFRLEAPEDQWPAKSEQLDTMLHSANFPPAS